MLESTLEVLQQFYIQMEIEPDDFYLFPGDSSLYTLRCMRCRKPVTVADSIRRTLLNAPTAMLYLYYKRLKCRRRRCRRRCRCVCTVNSTYVAISV